MIFYDLCRKYKIRPKKLSNFFIKKPISISEHNLDYDYKIWSSFENFYQGIGLTTTDDGNNYTFLNKKLDPYLFTNLTEIGNKLQISDLFPFQLIRSRVAVLDASISMNNKGWHVDENPYHVLRINIPLITHTNFLLHIDGYSPVHLEKQYYYSWNTKIPHRVYSDNIIHNKRIHLVLGYSPWFDFCKNEQKWIPSKYFGKRIDTFF